VPDLSHYEALGELVALVEATTRSNWALGPGAVAFKLAAAEVPFLPPPRPATEVFVWAPWFEAIHLRFGLVARGGIRWSDRQSDMRAEVLSLARAQVKKNSLIIPTGSKGGFSLRAGPGESLGTPLRAGAATGTTMGTATAAAPSPVAQAREAYRVFIASLLEVTDDIVDGEVVHPEGSNCLDGDDPYLVVAPDKGTAAFSDLANAISAGRGYWLGDAFASGGSHGYDHKALGITSKGAWEAVRRHFRALGMHPEKDPVRVVGVGDMSGDVFGNGMLQSRSLCLVAAFDHRHLFVDPDPDPERSFEERLRLSQAPGSTWADYDLAAASPGAAVYSRQDKQVELSPEARAVLGAGPGPMSPPELVSAALRAPVDMLFFGGIGTFVKGPGELDSEVDDEANDEVRVAADQVRARVVAEGANLAMTQRARVAYSRRGGRVNTDFVDNAAGVAMSDHEVNLKILLGMAVAGGRLGPVGRDEMLVADRDAVVSAVLGDVEASVVVLDRAALTSAADLPAWEALMADLEAGGLLDVAVESLPGAEDMSRRKLAGAGLSRPELAVLIAYGRSELARSVEASPLVADPALA
ncbi:MAG: NAD-glutamate dehydrogenase domain-containing protein, partial [Acidimicrobiales bacterium]